MRRNKIFENNPNSEIIDDVGLIQCINRLNTLRDKGMDQEVSLKKEKESDVLNDINRLSAEMRWFSQWLTAKVRSAA